ncbi:lysosomal proton-coupled steroid conjugate and bile acid symporter SLC46A3-like [Ruditapes philippinarum]|uniref:lysosomal proton-coupled steroid conjugate and bile acid symporter SLC46A3-like n=1 Tax=Ruditapes philippinarum TaxID=129788 RepID=UPI00295B9B8F|nr:lysosomal proton-coupled steroid conjugate and bile acid symporter SLC46A3-like [Ruditapes philippinarum]
MKTGETEREKTPLLKETNSSNGSKFGYKYFLLLLVMVFLYISVGITFYTISQWIQYKVRKEILQGIEINSTSVCEGTNQSDPVYEKFQTVEKKTAFWQMLNQLASSIPGSLAVLIIPSFSDSLGRKVLFVLPTTTILLKEVIYALIIYFEWDILWVVLASLFEGIFGSFYLFRSGMYAYIADITKPGRHRTLALTILEGSFLIFITLSGLAAGYFIEFEGFLVPMITCVGLIFFAWCIVIFALPETHEKHNRAKKMPFGDHMKRITGFYRSKQFSNKRSAYVMLLLAFFIAELTSSHRTSLEMLYQLGKPFCWPSQKIGLFSAARHATEGFAGLVLIAPLKSCFSEIIIAILSSMFNAGSYVLEAFADTDLILYLVPIPATFSFLMIPMIKTMMSSMTPSDKQGSLFSGIVFVEVLCSITATYLFNTIYSVTLSLFHGLVFLVLAGLCILVLIVLILFAMTQTVEIALPKLEKIVTN